MNEELTNIYVDILMGNLHKALNAQFVAEANYALFAKETDVKEQKFAQVEEQLKAQNELVEKQFEEIKRLETVVHETTSSVGVKTSEFELIQSQLQDVIRERDSLKNKSSQVDQFARQINSMNVIIEDHNKTISSLNEIILQKDSEIKSKEVLIEELKNPKIIPIVAIETPVKETKKTTKKK